MKVNDIVEFENNKYSVVWIKDFNQIEKEAKDESESNPKHNIMKIILKQMKFNDYGYRVCVKKLNSEIDYDYRMGYMWEKVTFNQILNKYISNGFEYLIM